jgi:hypothetical protein
MELSAKDVSFLQEAARVGDIAKLRTLFGRRGADVQPVAGAVLCSAVAAHQLEAVKYILAAMAPMHASLAARWRGNSGQNALQLAAERGKIEMFAVLARVANLPLLLHEVTADRVPHVHSAEFDLEEGLADERRFSALPQDLARAIGEGGSVAIVDLVAASVEAGHELMSGPSGYWLACGAIARGAWELLWHLVERWAVPLLNPVMRKDAFSTLLFELCSAGAFEQARRLLPLCAGLRRRHFTLALEGALSTCCDAGIDLVRELVERHGAAVQGYATPVAMPRERRNGAAVGTATYGRGYLPWAVNAVGTAALSGSVDAVRYLVLERGADVNLPVTFSGGATPLHAAVPLGMALVVGDLSMARVLLRELGAVTEPRAEGGQHCTPPLCSLLYAGLDPPARRETTAPPARTELHRWMARACQWLIAEAGADVNARALLRGEDEFGDRLQLVSPLQLAGRRGLYLCFEVLMEHGADVSALAAGPADVPTFHSLDRYWHAPLTARGLRRERDAPDHLHTQGVALGYGAPLSAFAKSSAERRVDGVTSTGQRYGAAAIAAVRGGVQSVAWRRRRHLAVLCARRRSGVPGGMRVGELGGAGTAAAERAFAST